MAGGLKLFDYRMTEKEHILAETIIEMTDKSELFRTGLEHFDWSEIKVIPTGDRPHDFSYTLKQEAWIELIDTYSSIHGVKGETFDALMLLIHGTVGNTLTPSFLANGKTNTELMRIAYVAMTRPRKLLVVAMPKNKAKLSNRFPPDKWDYVEL